MAVKRKRKEKENGTNVTAFPPWKYRLHATAANEGLYAQEINPPISLFNLVFQRWSQSAIEH
jgi:hypothetical protein